MASLSELLVKRQIDLSFRAGTSSLLGESEVQAAVRASLIALAQPYGEGPASREECRNRLVSEGVKMDGWNADPEQQIKAELAEVQDWEAGIAFIESLPEGSWTSFADFGKASGVSVPLNAAKELQREWERRVADGRPHIKNIHRVLKAGGKLERSWLPDNQAANLIPLADPESITVSKVCETEEAGETVWLGAAALSCRLPEDWGEYVEKYGVDLMQKKLLGRFGEEKTLGAIEDTMQYVTGELTRVNDLAVDPLIWIKFEKA